MKPNEIPASRIVELGDRIVLAAVIALPDDGIIRHSALSKAMDDVGLEFRDYWFTLNEARESLAICIHNKLRELGFKPMHPGADDWRQT